MAGTGVALRSRLAALAVIGVAALPLRLLLGALVPALLSLMALAPAVIRHTTTIAANFTEIVAVLAALAVYFRITRRGSFAEFGVSRQAARWLPVGLLAPLADGVVGTGSALVTG